MKYTLGSSAPLYIFHKQHKTFNNLYLILSEDQLQLQQSSDDEQGFIEGEDLINVLKHIHDKDMTFGNKSILLSSGQDNMTENKNMKTSNTESIFGFTIISHLIYFADIHPKQLVVMMTFINLKRFLMMFW